MSKKYSAGEKYDIIKRCINGEISQRHAAEMMDVHFSTIQDWIRIYEMEGIDGLTRKKNKTLIRETQMSDNCWEPYNTEPLRSTYQLMIMHQTGA